MQKCQRAANYFVPRVFRYTMCRSCYHLSSLQYLLATDTLLHRDNTESVGTRRSTDVSSFAFFDLFESFNFIDLATKQDGEIVFGKHDGTSIIRRNLETTDKLISPKANTIFFFSFEQASICRAFEHIRRIILYFS